MPDAHDERGRRFPGPRWLLAWVLALVASQAAASTVAADSAGPDPERGLTLLSRYHCGQCHRIPGVPAARSRTATALDGWGRRSYIAGRLPNDPATLARWIVDPAALVPGTLMPAMGVSPEDARHMAAYLVRLR